MSLEDTRLVTDTIKEAASMIHYNDMRFKLGKADLDRRGSPRDWREKTVGRVLVCLLYTWPPRFNP